MWKWLVLCFRPLPPLPDLEISEETIVKAADALQVYANHALSIARLIAIDRNLKLFLQVRRFSPWSKLFVQDVRVFVLFYFYGLITSYFLMIAFKNILIIAV